ncbi:MAG: cell division protein ZapA [Fervidobacterium sp.]|uniref:Cell division protein ZapA n=1 Tax=Fervidobacterium gondwanense DSM 13020 TaxID=1121883 RepID=A0A1M7SU99_FERGO|nr:cell division protein ZapA [Fervidobacterium gondwanense]UXF01301.1 cell division protein ZapA [Fervidobacterium riparium]SHN62031.1 Cell division protein ZapA [Fervidobacterium gondwanense DSM 13020]
MRKVKISVFGKDYEFATDGSDELIDYVQKRLRELQVTYRSLYEEIPFDELLVLIVCDLLEQEYNSQRQIDELYMRVKEKIKLLEGR